MENILLFEQNGTVYKVVETEAVTRDQIVSEIAEVTAKLDNLNKALKYYDDLTNEAPQANPPLPTTTHQEIQPAPVEQPQPVSDQPAQVAPVEQQINPVDIQALPPVQ